MCAPVDGKIYIYMRVCKRTCQDSKQTNKHTITRRTPQIWIKQTKAIEFLICIQNKSHMSSRMKQHTYTQVLFTKRMLEQLLVARAIDAANHFIFIFIFYSLQRLKECSKFYLRKNRPEFLGCKHYFKNSK